MKEFFTNPGVHKIAGVAAAAGLLVLGHYYPDLKEALDVLAGMSGIGPIAWHAAPPGAGGTS